jgi:hypothetical protein
MRGERRPERRAGVIADPELVARALHERCDPRVVDVGELREEMVLDLEVQPTQLPAEEEAAPEIASEVRQRLQV